MGNIAGGPGMKRLHLRAVLKLEIGDIVPGVFTPVRAKHSKWFSLIDCISVGVDRMQRNSCFGPQDHLCVCFCGKPRTPQLHIH